MLIPAQIFALIWPSALNVPELRAFLQAGGVFRLAKAFILSFADRYRSLTLAGIQSAKDPGDLKLEALRRVVCTSEDRDALFYAAMNLQVLRDERALSSLANDQEFCYRLATLQHAAMRETQHRRSSNRYSLIQSKVLSASYFHFMITTSSDPYIWSREDELVIQVSLAVHFDSEELSHLLKGSVLALNASCDQCSHCVTLLFSIRVAYIILESAKDRSLPDLHTLFKSVLGMSPGDHDLRLGFVVASAMLFPRRLTDEEWAVLNYQPQDTFLTALFAAYRET